MAVTTNRSKTSIVTKLATGHESDFAVGFCHPRKAIKRFIEEDEPCGLWTRQVLEDSDNNWLITIARRHPAVREKESGCCLILVRSHVVKWRYLLSYIILLTLYP